MPLFMVWGDDPEKSRVRLKVAQRIDCGDDVFVEYTFPNGKPD
jgi:hypothetical protein